MHVKALTFKGIKQVCHLNSLAYTRCIQLHTFRGSTRAGEGPTCEGGNGSFRLAEKGSGKGSGTCVKSVCNRKESKTEGERKGGRERETGRGSDSATYSLFLSLREMFCLR